MFTIHRLKSTEFDTGVADSSSPPLCTFFCLCAFSNGFMDGVADALETYWILLSISSRIRLHFIKNADHFRERESKAQYVHARVIRLSIKQDLQNTIPKMSTPRVDRLPCSVERLVPIQSLPILTGVGCANENVLRLQFIGQSTVLVAVSGAIQKLANVFPE